MSAGEAKIEALVRELNRAWRERRFEALYGFFRDDVVMAVPGQHEALVGVEAMVDSYRQFDAACKVHAFDIIAIDVFMREHMCICHVRFGVDYETDTGRRVSFWNQFVRQVLTRFGMAGLMMYAVSRKNRPIGATL